MLKCLPISACVIVLSMARNIFARSAASFFALSRPFMRRIRHEAAIQVKLDMGLTLT